jgi:hypothetical protein
MPPVSVKIIGNERAVPVRFIWLAIEILGSPLMIRLDTEQFVGVMVMSALTEPLPELFRVPSISPVTEIDPS